MKRSVAVSEKCVHFLKIPPFLLQNTKNVV